MEIIYGILIYYWVSINNVSNNIFWDLWNTNPKEKHEKTRKKENCINEISYQEKGGDVEDTLVEQVLDSISRRESKFHIYKRYDLVSPTADYGKYQLNAVHFYSFYGICKGITYQHFLNTPALQEIKARELMGLHIKILKQHNIKITARKLHLSWWGIGVALYNN